VEGTLAAAHRARDQCTCRANTALAVVWRALDERAYSARASRQHQQGGLESAVLGAVLGACLLEEQEPLAQLSGQLNHNLVLTHGFNRPHSTKHLLPIQ